MAQSVDPKSSDSHLNSCSISRPAQPSSVDICKSALSSHPASSPSAAQRSWALPERETPSLYAIWNKPEWLFRLIPMQNLAVDCEGIVRITTEWIEAGEYGLLLERVDKRIGFCLDSFEKRVCKWLLCKKLFPNHLCQLLKHGEEELQETVRKELEHVNLLKGTIDLTGVDRHTEWLSKIEAKRKNLEQIRKAIAEHCSNLYRFVENERGPKSYFELGGRDSMFIEHQRWDIKICGDDSSAKEKGSPQDSQE